MIRFSNHKKVKWGFLLTFLAILLVFFVSVLKTDAYNHVRHKETLAGEALFSAEAEKKQGLSLRVEPRGSTWTKAFDFYNEGITEHNYQAFTYDFRLNNDTKDEVAEFSYKLIFDRDVFLLSAWNGSVEIHQKANGGEIVATVPDLREFKASDYALQTVTFDGETMIHMKAGDYLIYYPNASQNVMEVPIKPHEGISPGFILYIPIGTNIVGTSVELEYTFHRLLTNEPLFWVAAIGLLVWLVALLIFVITKAQIKKYKLRHVRDNKIILESMETFTGFIDAKDSYTNGHSKRVAFYTRCIAAEMGYNNDELNRFYYIALLHDCGKIGVPDTILKKPGKLTDEEFKIIKSHTVRGGEILQNFKSLKGACDGALYHHERYDGRGYPAGLKGKDIPLIARIICVADSFDAMNSNRVYRKKLSKEYILQELEQNKGRQFDPEVADIFLQLLKEKKIDMDDPSIF